MYKMIGDTLTPINQIAYETQVAASTAQATADAARADFRRVVYRRMWGNMKPNV